jgi:hypothetical protein
MEREDLAGNGKGKCASGSNREAESTDAPERGGLLRTYSCASPCGPAMLVTHDPERTFAKWGRMPANFVQAQIFEKGFRSARYNDL